MTGSSCIPGATIAQGARTSNLSPDKDSKQTTRNINVQANTPISFIPFKQTMQECLYIGKKIRN